MAHLGYRTYLYGNDEDGWTAIPEHGSLLNDTTKPPVWSRIFGGKMGPIYTAKTRKKALKKSEKYLTMWTKPPVITKARDITNEVEIVRFESPW